MRDATIYDRLGGEDAVAAVVDEFYERVLGDDRLAGYFDDAEMADLREHQTKFLSAVTGAPSSTRARACARPTLTST